MRTHQNSSSSSSSSSHEDEGNETTTAARFSTQLTTMLIACRRIPLRSTGRHVAAAMSALFLCDLSTSVPNCLRVYFYFFCTSNSASISLHLSFAFICSPPLTAVYSSSDVPHLFLHLPLTPPLLLPALIFLHVFLLLDVHSIFHRRLSLQYSLILLLPIFCACLYLFSFKSARVFLYSLSILLYFFF